MVDGLWFMVPQRSTLNPLGQVPPSPFNAMSGHLPSVELLESTHQFPCLYAFKAIGLSTDCFVGRVLAAVKQELSEDAEPSFFFRTTAGGKHTSVTVEPAVDSAVRVIAIYHHILALEGIVMVM